MKQSIIIITVIISMLMVGCKKQDDAVAPGSIHGIVSDASSGELIQNASVKLQPKGLQTVTGSDGRYHFAEIDPGQYNLFIEKVGYQSLSHNITVNSGESANGDVQIEKLPASLQIMDNDGQPVTELNFGGDPGIVSKTFKIYNKGTEPFSFEISKYVDWIESITPHNSTVVPVNGNCPVVVKIDRSKLADGQNTTSIIITSPTVGGVELIVKARKGSSGDVFELPAAQLMVQLEDLGCVNWNSAKTLCESSTVADYNDWRLPTKEELMTLYSNREEIGGFTMGEYWSSSTISTPSTKYYYVNFTDGTLDYDSQWSEFHIRAVRTYIPENDVFELTSANLMVQTQDIGNVGWSSAKLLCENSTVGDHNDWRLPTKEELMVLYNNRDIIGGFTTKGYWSSSESSSTHYYYVNFGTGSYYSASYSDSHNVRAVRTLNGTPTTTPTIETLPATNITTNSATCGGNVTSDGGATVTERGVCYSTSQNPTIYDMIVPAGGGTGSYTCSLTGLSPSTTYYVRAYATNSVGSGYGAQKTFTTDSNGGGSIGYEFTESFESGIPSGWATIDADGDGNNWYSLNPNNNTNNIPGHNGSLGHMTSASYNGTVLTPDNYLVTPQVTATNSSTFSFWACAQDNQWANEHFGVYVSTSSQTNANSFVKIQEWTMTAKRSGITSIGRYGQTRDQGSWYKYTVDLGNYANQNIYIAIRHFNSTDNFRLNVDDVELSTSGGGSVTTTWSDNFDNGSLSNWTLVDADGDGNNWLATSPLAINVGNAHSGSYCASSWSWDNVSFDPDNYMISPICQNATSIRYYVATHVDYPDHYAVMVSSTGTNPSDFTIVFEETAPVSKRKGDSIKTQMQKNNKTRDMSPWTERNINLPPDTKYVAFRHFNSYDMNYIFIDDITITMEQ